MDRAKLKQLAKRRLDGRVVICFALMLLVCFAFMILGVIPTIGWLATIILSGPVALSTTLIFYKVAIKNKTPEIEDLMYGFSDDNFLRGMVGYLLYSIFTFLWSPLLIVPGIIKAISYSQMYYIMIDHPEMDASAAIKKSMQLMEGHKWEYFVLELSFIPWYLLVGLTFGLMYIWVGPYVATTKAAYYREISSVKSQVIAAAKKTAKKLQK